MNTLRSTDQTVEATRFKQKRTRKTVVNQEVPILPISEARKAAARTGKEQKLKQIDWLFVS